MKCTNGTTQRVDERNGLISLVVFSPVFMAIKLSNGSFFVFSADDGKTSVTVCNNYLKVHLKNRI